jgi:hypothetical protein
MRVQLPLSAMSARRHGVAIAVTFAVLLPATPAAFARATVTVDVGPAVGLFRGSSPIQTVAVGSSETQERSCEAGKTKSRVRVGGSHRLGQVERKGAVVACEQPPRSILNVSGLKSTEANALTAAG